MNSLRTLSIFLDQNLKGDRINFIRTEFDISNYRTGENPIYANFKDRK